MRLVVIGGGISGLAAAWVASRSDPSLEVVVLEKEARAGGKAVTHREDGWRVEYGPTGYMAPDTAVDRLIRESGLGDEVVPAESTAAHRFVVRRGRMREVSAHPLKFARSGILGPAGMLRLLAEPVVRARGPAAGDESVWSFAKRRIGRQAADRLVAPMVLGVFAGDARKLSLASAFPRLAALEAEHGSLVRGMFAAGRAARAERGGGPAGPRGHLTSLADGMGSLAEALVRGPFELRRGCAAERVQTRDGGYAVRAGGETLSADAVILAGEAFGLAPVVEELSPALAAELAPIEYPPVAVVALGFEEAAWAAVPRGFGVLVPRGEGIRTLGFLWESHIFPGRSPERRMLLRAMVGGAVDPDAALGSEDDLVALVLKDAAALLSISQPPVFRHVQRWRRAIPQYELGHGERVARIEAALEHLPGVAMAGNALHGIAFGKAVETGIAAAEQSVAFLRRKVDASAGD